MVPHAASSIRSNLLLLLIPLVAALHSCQTGHVDGKVEPKAAPAMLVQYLEIVTPEVANTCATLEQIHGVTFGDPEPSLGNARVAPLLGGGKLGVRGPLRPDEEPIVRSYRLVDDIQGALDTAAAAGAVIALPPMPLPGHGTCAIYIQDGVEHGLWSRPPESNN